MAVDVLADMFLKPRLTVEDIAREKRVVQEEISMYEDSPLTNWYTICWLKPSGLSIH